tara:strand:- start:34 stop:534 length:501 start_codon:yes stop_codon:yes gene_type:complete
MSNPEMILAFDTYDHLKKIVDAKGADYVYEESFYDNCMYWDYEKDTPSCIVGHYFYEKGFIRDSEDARRIENSIATIPISMFEHTQHVEFSQAAKALLLAAQQRQDRGWTWGHALAFGLEVAHYCIDQIGEADVDSVAFIDRAIQICLNEWYERGDFPLYGVEELA